MKHLERVFASQISPVLKRTDAGQLERVVRVSPGQMGAQKCTSNMTMFTLKMPTYGVRLGRPTESREMLLAMLPA